MLESDNTIQCNMESSNIQEMHYDINSDEYNKIYNKKKLELFGLNILTLCLRCGAVSNELLLLNSLREDFIGELSTTDIIYNISLLFCIFLQTEIDRFKLDDINNVKQQLELIKQKDIETLKRLSKTIK